jgi:phosphoglycolate phosphatase
MSLVLPALIFDLDGTLTDSKPGILGCLSKVIEAHNLGDQGPLDHFIGPPVEEWVTYLLPSGTAKERAGFAHEYRACYDREGWRNNSVFPGVRGMLIELQEQGFPLYVCTSKQQHFAVRILDAFDLSPFFTAIYGDKLEFTSHSKVDLLANLLSERSLAPDTAWMIGDRSFDIDAAHANRLPCLAAGWGYGSAEECSQADAIANTPTDVAALVTPKQPSSAR